MSRYTEPKWSKSALITILVFSGCNFPNCPRSSIYEASERDFRVVLVEDAVSGLYELGKQEMRKIGVALISTDKVIDAVMHNAKPA